MRCPFCKTENRDDLETCYSCEKDLSMLRLIVQKARAHFNRALEFAERDRNEEAIAELGEEEYSIEDIRLVRIKFLSELGN